MLHTRLTAHERKAYDWGRRCFEHGDVEPALEALTKLQQTHDNFADVHYMVGVLLDQQGDSNGARASLQQAIRINPGYAEALLALATLYERLGEFDRSREFADRALLVSRTRGGAGSLDATTRGKLANLQAALADAYVEAGDLREGTLAYRKALDRCPDFHDIRYRLGRCLREAGLPDRAMLEFKRVLRARPDLNDARAQLALTYYTLGRVQDAREQWKQVLEYEPAHRVARMYLRLVGSETATRPKSETGID